MFGHKKIPNPKVEEFKKNLESRGFLVIEGIHNTATLLIPEREKFISFLKRNGDDVNGNTVFFDKAYGEVTFFALMNGAIVRTVSFPQKVKA